MLPINYTQSDPIFTLQTITHPKGPAINGSYRLQNGKWSWSINTGGIALKCNGLSFAGVVDTEAQARALSEAAINAADLLFNAVP